MYILLVSENFLAFASNGPFFKILLFINRFISSVKHSAASKSCFLRTKQVAKADLEALELLHQSQVMEGRVSDIRHIVGNGNFPESSVFKASYHLMLFYFLVSHDLKTPMQAVRCASKNSNTQPYMPCYSLQWRYPLFKII